MDDRHTEISVRYCNFTQMWLINENNVETVVLLSGGKVDGHIDIDLDVEKLEGKSGPATYAEIKAYIKAKYEFNVTSLYIGQIKDKAGIKDRKKQSWMPLSISD